MKKMIAIAFLSIAASSALATGGGDVGSSTFEGYPSYAKECALAAIPKLEAKAEQAGAVLDESTITISSIDNRALNPFKYIWFTGVAISKEGHQIQVQALTQKPPFKKCF